MSPESRSLKELFLAALAIEPGARRDWLTRECGDSVLRRQVEAMLAAHECPQSLLDGLAPDERKTEVRPAILQPETAGAELAGRYKLLEQIGEGGMGSVWMAQQIEPVKRLVAVKLIKAGMDSKQVIARFEAERQALALMDHPNIAKVLDAGTTGSDRPYFVMELVKGIPITKYCDEHRLTPRQRLELFIPVCQAVQHAHQKGIIHRDLKPSNVLVALYDGQPVPKVIDFGVAKAAGQALTDKTLVTGFGAIVGTLEYMSPEQAETNQLDIDTRSDIYSLGVLLYELLTGSPPFSREEIRNAGLLEMLRVIREEEPSKPSTKLSTAEGLPTLAANRGTEPANLARLVRGDLDWIVMKALEKDRTRRYESANAFARDLQRHLADEPVDACPPSVSYRMRKFARRNKMVIGAAALAALMLTVVAAAVVENFRREAKAGEEARERSLQKQQEDTRKREEYATRLAKTESVVNMALAQSDSLAKQAALAPTDTSREASAAVAIFLQAEAQLAQAEATLANGLSERPVRERVSDARSRLNQAKRQADQQLARTLREEKLFRDLDEANMARPSMAGDHLAAAAASALFEKAFKDYGLELKPNQADAFAKRIQMEKPELRDALIAGIDNWGFVAAARSAMSGLELGKIARAADDDIWRTAYRKSVANNEPATLVSLAKKARDQSLPPASIYLLALSLDHRKQRAEAVDLLRWARVKHPKDMWIPYHLALMLESPSRRPAAVVEEQIGCYRLFLAMRPDSPLAWNNLGGSLAKQGKLDEAITCLRVAAKLKPDYAKAHGNLGNALGTKGLLDDALAANDEAIRLLPESAEYYSNRGMILLKKGLVDQAIAAYEKAIKLNPEIAAIHSNLAFALLRKAQFKEAIAACETAIRLDPTFAAAHDNLGSILAEQKKFEAAIVAFEQAIRLDPDDFHAYLGLALVLSEMKRFPAAEMNCRIALKLNPNTAGPHSTLGILLGLQDKNQDAIASFREALRHQPDDVDAHYNLGLLFIKLKQADDALAEMELIIKHDPRNWQAYYQIGRIHAERKQHAEAIKFFKLAVTLKEDSAEVHFQLGVSQRELNQLDAAGASFKKATSLDATHAPAHLYLGLVHEQQKRPDDAFACFKEALRLKPDNAQAHYNLGILLADKNQLAAAADAFRQAITCDKDYAKAHNNLGVVLARQGKVADAIPCFREALRCQPDYPLARQLLAQALNAVAWPLVVSKEATRADAERAVKLAREAVELTPKDTAPWNTLGVAYYRAGQWDDAIPALKKSANLSKEVDWYSFLFLAMTYWKKGDKDEARTWYDRGVMRIRDQRINTDDSRRFQAEAAALLGVAKESK